MLQERSQVRDYAPRRRIELDEHEIGRPGRPVMKNPSPPVGNGWWGMGATDQAGNPLIGKIVDPLSNQVIDVELIRWDLRSYIEIEANTTPVAEDMFTKPVGTQYTPQGGTAFNLALLHTNLQSLPLPNPQRHLTRGLAMWIREDIFVADLVPWKYETLGTFLKTDTPKPYHQQLLAALPCLGAGTTGIGTPATNVTLLSNGWPVANNYFALPADDTDPGVTISQGESFKFTIDPTQNVGGWTTNSGKTTASGSGGTGIHAWILLVGTLLRSKS